MLTKYKNVAGIVILFFSFYINNIQGQDCIVNKHGDLPEKVSNNAVVEGFVDGIPYLYSFGGIDSTKKYSGIHLRSFRYNLETSESIILPELPDTLGKIAASANRIGDIIYIIGGYHVFSNNSEKSSDLVHRFDIKTNSFLSNGAKIPIPIDDQVQCVYRDSLIYVVSGWSNNGNIPNVQIYDPTNDIWTSGTSTPDLHSYKSFGSAGAILGDTLYYFGGAASAGSFGSQNSLRKGYINPADPTQITWSISVPDSQIKGYRPAATTVYHQIHWIGGSSISYNFDGISYSNGQGVPPANRDLYLDVTSQDQLFEKFGNDLPMDLRGLADLNDTLKFTGGGMLSGQQVTSGVYKIEYINAINSTDPISVESWSFDVSHNPILNGNLVLNIEGIQNAAIQASIYNELGMLVYQSNIDVGDITIPMIEHPTGIYWIVMNTPFTSQQKKFIHIND